MDSEIRDIRLKFNCPADWDKMPMVEGGRYCNLCKKNVYDFSDAKQQEFLNILAENNHNICGRFRQEQMDPAIVKFPIWKKWFSAAMVLIGINIFNNKAEAQHKKADTVKVNKPANDTFVNGMVVSSYAKFFGGNEAFARFISHNLHYTSGMKNGKVYASFTVERGTVFKSKYYLIKVV